MKKRSFQNIISSLLLTSIAILSPTASFSQNMQLIQNSNGKLAITPSPSDATSRVKLAATVSHASGPAKLTRKEEVMTVNKGMQVFEGDKISTTSSQYVELHMIDKGQLIIKPFSEVEIVTYRLEKDIVSVSSDIKVERGSSSALINILKGSLRSITGAIQKSQYRLSTPTATIGIRGTDHETIVVLEGEQNEENIDLNPGTYNTVYSGQTAMTDTKGNTITILPNTTGFTPLIINNPNIINPVLTPQILPSTPSIIINKKIDFINPILSSTPAPVVNNDGKTCRPR